jgi:hypothetical protein
MQGIWLDENRLDSQKRLCSMTLVSKLDEEDILVDFRHDTKSSVNLKSWELFVHLSNYSQGGFWSANLVQFGRIIQHEFSHLMTSVCLRFSEFSPHLIWKFQLALFYLFGVLTLQFRLVHLILDKNLKTQSLFQHITSKNTSNVFT